MGQLLEVRIRADKTGPQPPYGVAWPVAGVEIVGDLQKEVVLPHGWVQRMAERGLLKLVGKKEVERPARNNPDFDNAGSAKVSKAHEQSDDLPMQPKKHRFVQADKIVFDTLNHGKVTYKVTYQPDKYVDSDDPTEKVTKEHYESGNTRVDAFYRCTLEG